MIKKYGFESLGWITLQERALVVTNLWRGIVKGLQMFKENTDLFPFFLGRWAFLYGMIRGVGKVCYLPSVQRSRTLQGIKMHWSSQGFVER